MSDRIEEIMRARSQSFAGLLVFCLVGLFSAWSVRADELSDSDKFFLAGYEKLRVALVADDLVRVNEAAAELSESGFEVPKSETLERARDAFAKASEIAIKVAGGQPGYYVMHCPKLNRDWVQTSSQVSNPYGGKDMVGCGEVKK
jgi:hypothetical protein